MNDFIHYEKISTTKYIDVYEKHYTELSKAIDRYVDCIYIMFKYFLIRGGAVKRNFLNVSRTNSEVEKRWRNTNCFFHPSLLPPFNKQCNWIARIKCSTGVKDVIDFI